MKATFFGVKGYFLSQDEIDFLKKENPFGIILFKRNIKDKNQLNQLVQSIQNTLDRGVDDLPIIIDQEGGRVQRMNNPSWRKYPPADVFVKNISNFENVKKAVDLNARLIAKELLEYGINVDALPLLDVPVDGADNIIGDRAFSNDANVVSILGEIQKNALLQEGVFPIIKHIPGHGRALVDSHLDLPYVCESYDELKNTDFVPFYKNNYGAMAMVAHIVFEFIDDQIPISISKTGIDFIRKEFEFDDLIMPDDVSMKALKGCVGQLSKQALDAGCDISLHCNGDMGEMIEIANNIGFISDVALERFEKLKKYKSDNSNIYKNTNEILNELQEFDFFDYSQF